MRVLVTGATGYIGGLLVPQLLREGHAVRVLARDPARVAGRRWASQVEIARGDVLAPETLRVALRGCDTAYYLVHSMGSMARFDERDRAAAGHFAEAAETERLSRIVYLGGLGDDRAELSEHLASRHATGDRLRQGAVPVTELRAAIVVGAGSVSFEMIRCLTERIPIMICPRWVYQRVQPIAVRDVLAYLVAALTHPGAAGEVIEIGGADVLTYRDLMLGFAELRGLRRLLVPVPVLSPALSSHWVHWITPVPRDLAAPLIAGLRSEVVVRDHRAQRLFPSIAPLGYRAALAEALGGVERGDIQSSWSDALATSQRDAAPVTLAQGAGLIVERRQRTVEAAPGAVFRTFSGLGGARGWLYAGWAWRLRGALDRLLGGVGLRRGRRDPDEVRVGDALDFWRVEEVQPGRLLRLRAEMKVPGRAWLQFEVHPAAGGARLVQTAYFAPRGLTGLAYWYLLYPIHALIFGHLIERIGARATAARDRRA